MLENWAFHLFTIERAQFQTRTPNSYSKSSSFKPKFLRTLAINLVFVRALLLHKCYMGAISLLMASLDVKSSLKTIPQLLAFPFNEGQITLWIDSPFIASHVAPPIIASFKLIAKGNAP